MKNRKNNLDLLLKVGKESQMLWCSSNNSSMKMYSIKFRISQAYKSKIIIVAKWWPFIRPRNTRQFLLTQLKSMMKRKGHLKIML